MRVLLLLSLLAAATSFVLLPQSTLASSPRPQHGLLDSTNNPEDAEHQDELEEIAAARRRLEFLVNDFEDDSTENNGNDEIPLLSTIGRQRKEVEIELLQALGESDEPTGDLWTLWYSERGPQAHAELRQIEETLFADPSHWQDAEAKLQDMIAQHGMQFCEPLNRLATLYYMQGRYAESKKLCQLVLDQKPWHFGALSGIVMVCASMKDIQGARQWAARRLPPMVPNGTTDNHRRKQWARRAVDDARKALMEEEERIRQAFGKRQRYETQLRQEQSQQLPDDDSWQ